MLTGKKLIVIDKDGLRQAEVEKESLKYVSTFRITQQREKQSQEELREKRGILASSRKPSLYSNLSSGSKKS